jgi:hypothetical protein
VDAGMTRQPFQPQSIMKQLLIPLFRPDDLLQPRLGFW